jgi:hypothetical protein
MITAALFNFLTSTVSGERPSGSSSSPRRLAAALYLVIAGGCLVLAGISIVKIITGSPGFLVLLGVSALVGGSCAYQVVSYVQA